MSPAAWRAAACMAAQEPPPLLPPPPLLLPPWLVAWRGLSGHSRHSRPARQAQRSAHLARAAHGARRVDAQQDGAAVGGGPDLPPLNVDLHPEQARWAIGDVVSFGLAWRSAPSNRGEGPACAQRTQGGPQPQPAAPPGPDASSGQGLSAACSARRPPAWGTRPSRRAHTWTAPSQPSWRRRRAWPGARCGRVPAAPPAGRGRAGGGRRGGRTLLRATALPAAGSGRGRPPSSLPAPHTPGQTGRCTGASASPPHLGGQQAGEVIGAGEPTRLLRLERGAQQARPPPHVQVLHRRAPQRAPAAAAARREGAGRAGGGPVSVR